METTRDHELAAWLQRRYAFSAPLEISLLRAYTNDVYRVFSPRKSCVLKVYGRAWRSEGEIRYELDLLEHLARQGLPVARPIRAASGDALSRLGAGPGRRFAVLFEHAAGAKPQPPFSPRLYALFGEAIGRMHELSKGFTSAYPRQALDLACLVRRPLRVLLPLLAARPAEAAGLRRLGEWIEARLEALRPAGLDWGPVHGDASLDNLHVLDRQQVILYDFDSGGPGWRASDLQGWAVGLPEYHERYHAFLDGYRQARPLREQDLQASGCLALAWELWGMQVDVQRRVAALGPRALDEYLTQKLACLREREQALG